MKDLVLSTDGDLSFEDGDFVIGESASQSAKLVLIAAPGDFRQFPALGVGLMSFLNDSGEDGETSLRHRVENHIKYDGGQVQRLRVAFAANGQLQIAIKAKY